jgi:hypothetical protein
MSENENRLWPFGTRVSLIAAAFLLVGLLLLVAALRATLEWPGAEVENTVLVGVLALSLMPILLAFADTLMERGAVIEYGGVRVDFSQSRAMGTAGITVAANIGVRGRAVTDSSTTEILDALRQATGTDVAIIDLEAGDAWWETRLLVLLAGAARLGKPDKIVFVGMDAGKEQRFQGWSYARDLFQLLTAAHPQYLRSLQAARSAAGLWELVSPVNPAPLGVPVGVPAIPAWLAGSPATQYQWMAFDSANGLRNALLEEQVLQSDLGQQVEMREGSRGISLVRLEEVFRPILAKEHVDLNWEADRQLQAVLESRASFLAVTQDGKYTTLVSRLTLLGEPLTPLLRGRKRK